MRTTGPTADLRIQAVERTNGLCQKCWRPGSQLHHRKPRGAGGTSDPTINALPNLVWLCLACHAHIEQHRLASYETGWLVRRNANPAEQYLIDNLGRMLMLLPDGSVTYSDVLPDVFLPSGDLTPPF
jgi:5-methylcytosine-specific restriction endonuclease McrA